jgi:uncharacterized protein (DUF433 family)
MLSLAAEPVPFAFDAHGVARVGGSRVTLEVLLGTYLMGETAEQLHEDFPTVPLSEVHATIAYYWRHQEEVDRYIAEAVERGEALRRQIEGRSGAEAWRSELLRRRAERDASVPH